MPLPEDEKTWAQLDVMFATTRGTVRRNKLSDFVDVRRSGIIAMKLDEGEGIVDVQIAPARRRAADLGGRPMHPFCGHRRARVPGSYLHGRARHRAVGGRQGDLAVDLRHTDATGDERAAYLKHAGAVRRGLNGVEAEEGAPDVEEAQEFVGNDAIELGEQRYVSMSAAEQFVLTISERGYGKRSSSYEYRITGRGGKGIVAMDVRERDGTIRKKTGKLIASFPVEDGDQLMLVTDGGQLIRTRVEGIRIVGRSTQGVIVFDTAEGERVVSVERISEEGDDNGG